MDIHNELETNQDDPWETRSAQRRGFVAIHRDVWRVVAKSPAIFLLIPAVIYIPTNVLIEFSVAQVQGDFEQFRAYSRLGAFETALIGTLTTAILLAAMSAIAEGRQPTVGESIEHGLRLWGRLLYVWWSISWRVGLALLLAIIPGIYLLVRYALSEPAVAFEGQHGAEALRKSYEYTKGNWWRIFLGVLAAGALYAPITIVGGFLIPEDATPVTAALMAIPTNVITSLLIVGLTLLYVECHPDWNPAEPLGRPRTSDELNFDEPVPSGYVILIGASIVSVGTLVLGFGLAFGPAYVPSYLGDLEYENGDFKQALSYYELAVKLDSSDAFAQYSLGITLEVLDDFERAEEHLAKAASLEPGEAFYVVAHVRCLVALGRVKEARDQFEIAKSTGELEPEEIQDMEYLIEITVGDMALEKDDYNTARSHFERALQIAPQEAYAYFSIGYIFIELEDFASAEKFFKRAVQLDPEDPEYLSEYALCLIRLERVDEARDQIDAAKKTGFADPEVIQELERLLDRQPPSEGDEL